MKTFYLFISFLLLLSACRMREDPEVLKPFLEDVIKRYITDETGQVSVNNFQVTGSKNSEKSIEGLSASIVETDFTCEFRLEEDAYWMCSENNTFELNDLNMKGLASISCFRKVSYGYSSSNPPPLVSKGTVLNAEGKMLFVEFEKKIRPSITDIKIKYVSIK